MAYADQNEQITIAAWMGGYLPDFILATLFFTSLIYAVLGQRFSRQRAVAVASLAIGLALSTGIVWWEAGHGYSIRDLGPLGIGFAILLLSAVMYRALQDIGGRFSGIALTLGSSVVIGWILGIRLPIKPEVIRMITVVALLAGILALVRHQHRPHRWFPQQVRTIPSVRNDLRGVRQDSSVANWIHQNLRRARVTSRFLHDRPDLSDDVLVQLKRMLPVQGYLTKRLARLRERAHRMRHGHVARIKEIRQDISELPPEAKRKLSEELAARYEQLKFDFRLERLDKACAETERRIRDLTQQARTRLARHDFRRVTEILKHAEKLQAHNTRLFAIIDRTEVRLGKIAVELAKKFAGGGADE
jgi:hypothetical protein